MEWKPSRWLAALAALIIWPFGLLYIGRWWLPVAYFTAFLVAAIIEYCVGTPMYVTIAIMLVSPIHAFWLAHKASAFRRPWYSRWYGMAAITISFFVSIALIRSLLIEPFRIPSTAMEPTLPRGSFVVVSKMGYRNFGTYGVTLSRNAPVDPPNRGAIVVFNSPVNPSLNFVKRVLGVPGDSITSKNKVISVNGVPLAQNHRDQIVKERLEGSSYETIINTEKISDDFHIVVPVGHFFLVGDNRDGSFDSRNFGPVSAELLIGEVMYVFTAKRP